MSDVVHSGWPPPDAEEPALTLRPLAALKLSAAFSRIADPAFARRRVAPLQCVILHMCAEGRASTLTELAQTHPWTAPPSAGRWTFWSGGACWRGGPTERTGVVRLALTREGWQLMPNLDVCLAEVDALLLYGVSPAEREMLSRVIEKIYDNSVRLRDGPAWAELS